MPAKRAKLEQPPKKKEDVKEKGRRFSPVRAPAQHLEKQPQPNTSSGVTVAPRRKVDFVPTKGPRHVSAPKAKDNRDPPAHRPRSQAPPKNQAPHAQVPWDDDFFKEDSPAFKPEMLKAIEAIVHGINRSYETRRGRDRSPSPHCSYDHRSRSHHHSRHRGDCARFEREEEEEERGRSRSRGRDRSRSRSRG